MRKRKALGCSCSLVCFFAGFCLGLGQIVYVFHCGLLTQPDSPPHETLQVVEGRRRDAPDSRKSEVRRIRNNKKDLSGTLKVKNVRLLCWVMTQEQNLADKAQMIKDTWGKRCDVTLYFTAKTNRAFPTIGLDVHEGRRHLFVMTSRAFRYIHAHHLDDADWFLKADDDTYVIVENLRHFLQDKNTSSPVYYGQIFQRYAKGGYNSGGAGYVLGREALRRFVLDGSKQFFCNRRRGSEDVAMGKCLYQLNVTVGVTKDGVGKERFNWHNGFSVIAGIVPPWVKRYTGNNTASYRPSDSAISFHYINSQWMKVLEFLIYNLTVRGLP